MLDATAQTEHLQRIHGHAAVRIGSDGRVLGLRQQGAAKVMLPKMHGRPPEVVFLNTAGGVTAGDRLTYDLDVDAGARAVGTTQTAERAYRANGGFGAITTTLRVGAGARLHWLPQEVILFDGSALERRLNVEMAADAEVILLETLVLGRAAMGETLRAVHLRDRRTVTRAGQIAMLDPVELTSRDLTQAGTAGLDGAVALASLWFFAPQAQDALAAVRAALPTGGPVRAAASAWDGRVSLRAMAPDGYPLRRAVARVIETLTQGPVPRVWQI